MARSHASSTGAFGLDSGSGNVEMIDAPMLKQVNYPFFPLPHKELIAITNKPRDWFAQKAETTIANAKAAGLKIPDV
jgi:hypothetical protein